MAIEIDINSSSVYEARDAVRELEARYKELNKEIDSINSSTDENNRLTITQQKEMEGLTNELSGLNKEMNSYYKVIDDLDEYNLTASFEDMNGAIVPLSTQISTLQDRLYQMKIAGEENTEEFQMMVNETGRLQQAIRDTDLEISILGGNSGVAGLRQQFGALGTSLADLDFNNANRSLEGMGKTIKAIDVGKMAKDFGKFAKTLGTGLVKGLGMATKAVAKFTLSLLANPVVLIAAGVIALVTAVALLLDKFGLLQPIIDALMVPFNLLMEAVNATIQAFKDLTDWFGWTDNAGDELRSNEKKRAEEKLKETEEMVKSDNNRFSNELRILQARGVNTEEEILQEQILKISILANEKEKTEAKQKALEADIAIRKASGKLNEEELEELKEQELALKDLALTIDNINTDIELVNMEAADKNKKLNEKASKEELDIINKKNQEALKANEEYKKKLEAQAKLRIEALKFIEDISYKSRIESIENQYDREFEIITAELEKEREEILRNKTLTREEILVINDYYDKLEDAAKKKRDDSKLKDEQDVADNIMSNNEKIAKMMLDQKIKQLEELNSEDIAKSKELLDLRYKADKEFLENEREEILKDKTLTNEQIQDINEYYRREELSLKEKHNDAKSKVDEDYDNKSIEEAKEFWNKLNQIMLDSMEAGNLGLAEGTFNLAMQVNDSITSIVDIFETTGSTLKEKALAIAGASMSLINSILSEVSNQNKRILDEDLAYLEEKSNQALSIIDSQLENQSISQDQYNAKKYAMELDQYNKEEVIKKKAFEQDKKMKIAQASISMVQGMVSAFAGAMSLGPIAGPIVGGVLAAAVGVMGALNISKIKKTKYEAGAAPSPSAAPSIDVGGMDNVRDESIETGQTNQYGKGESETLPENNKMEFNVKSTVSVTELDDVSKKVKNYDYESEL